MKEIKSNSLQYTQKEVVVGNKMRSVIIINNKKPGAKLAASKHVNTNVRTIKRKKCSGCGRKRRG